ncbi:LOW QUALITY PROTEIN: uncharacterized protein LOC108025021, partial [Drosophila biarmipes]|uniref:LOW QUALITY PROTEIN: uncharacterized protein LOC108025021 n=1 Tax=Drosophila biarmipes TaxID=125945 RepID=UPI0021CCE222
LGSNNTFFGSWLSWRLSSSCCCRAPAQQPKEEEDEGSEVRRKKRARAEERREPEQSTTTTSSAPHAHTTQQRRRPDLDLPASHPCHSSRSLDRAPWFPLRSGKESRAPCVPSSLKPKSQSRRGDAIVAHGAGSSLLAHSHTDLISSLARHCVTLSRSNHRSNHHEWNSTTQSQGSGKQPVLRWVGSVGSRCMCIVRKLAGDIPTSIGIVPHSCSRLLGLGSASVSCDTCLAHLARLGLRIGPLTESTCPRLILRKDQGH